MGVKSQKFYVFFTCNPMEPFISDVRHMWVPSRALYCYSRMFKTLFNECSKQCDSSTDIQGRSQTSYTALCNGVVSHGLKLGVFWFLPSTHARTQYNTNASTIFARHGRFYACSSSHSTDRSRCRWYTHLTNHGYLWLRENPNNPNLGPMQGSKWRRFWNLPCLSEDSSHLLDATRPNLWSFMMSPRRHTSGVCFTKLKVKKLHDFELRSFLFSKSFVAAKLRKFHFTKPFFVMKSSNALTKGNFWECKGVRD